MLVGLTLRIEIYWLHQNLLFALYHFITIK